MMLETVFVILAYILGSIPFGYLLVKYVFTGGEDIRRVGSGGTGATNVTRRAGKGAGALTLALDAAKGAGAVTLMRTAVADDYLWIGAAAIAAILGHIFPVFLKFRGGKGVATGMGVFAAVAPYPALAALALWAAVVYLTRYVSLGSIVATLSLPLWMLLFYGWLRPDPDLRALLVIGFVGGAIVVAKHHENIGRLMRGTENRLGARINQKSVKINHRSHG
ncbi:MAG: glycerol-3-phosphate 1-O-acyltransferase PlsY [Blastocatellia bacterium]|nr:glycerol-3-phosphate 1-O-acyltransferase PlsY [Blastocatellia bacterium]